MEDVKLSTNMIQIIEKLSRYRIVNILTNTEYFTVHLRVFQCYPQVV
jgi:hypothetical protein